MQDPYVPPKLKMKTEKARGWGRVVCGVSVCNMIDIVTCALVEMIGQDVDLIGFVLSSDLSARTRKNVPRIWPTPDGRLPAIRMFSIRTMALRQSPCSLQHSKPAR